jgi:hypothetical protein
MTESKLLNLNSASQIRNVEFLVNESFISSINKTILINLPIDIDFDRLSRYNEIISRFPIKCDHYSLLPYVIEEHSQPLDVSPLILTKQLLSDIDQIDNIKNKKFLIGVNPITEDYLNLVGYLLINNNLTTGSTNL